MKDPIICNGPESNDDHKVDDPTYEGLRMDSKIGSQDQVKHRFRRRNIFCKVSGYQAARWIAWSSIFVTFILSFIGFNVQEETQSASTLANSMDSFIDVFCSFLLLWRFWGDEQDDAKLERREEKAQVLIGFTFVLLTIVVAETGFKHIEEKDKVKDMNLVLALAVPSFLIQLILGYLKVKVAKGINSEALRNDGISSLLGSCLSGGIIIDTIALEINPSIWYFDAAFAIVVAIILGIVALSTLIKFPWWLPSFWCGARDSSFDHRELSSLSFDDDEISDFDSVEFRQVQAKEIA